MELFNNTLKSIIPVSEEAGKKARARLDNIAKPLNSLGIFEEILVQIASIHRDSNIDISKRALVIMCADNGVVAQGVTQSDASVTLIMSGNFVKGRTTVCRMSESINVAVVPVDVGIDTDMKIDGLLDYKVMKGTHDISLMPAMSREQAIQAIEAGIQVASDLVASGHRLLVTGEMGIGNTTSTAAVITALSGLSADNFTGRGAGLDSAKLEKKIEIVEKAVKVNNPDKNDPIDVLSKVGGLDIAGLVGVYLGAAANGVPVLIDGVISGVAALLAVQLNPLCADYMIATHLSKEPAGQFILNALKMRPFIDAGMCLGEGTGAVAGLTVLDMMVHVYKTTASFQEVDIEEYIHFK